MSIRKRGRHARPSQTKTNIKRAAFITGGGIVALNTGIAPASADVTNTAWDAIIQCESGDQNIENQGPSTASGYFQITDPTWSGAGGGEFAPRAIDATFAQQFIVAQRIAERAGGFSDWNASKSCWGGKVTGEVPVVNPPVVEPAPVVEVAPIDPAPVAAGTQYTVVTGDYLSTISVDWRPLWERNRAVIGENPNLIFPGQVLDLGDTVVEQSAQTPVEEGPIEETPVEEVTEAAEVLPNAVIANSAGPVSAKAQAAANSVFAHVLGAQLITIGGTRSSAIDPNGHPSGNALDYMVLADAALGNAIAQYNIDNWDALGVEYIIWQQRILTSPGGSWEPMEDRGGITANHMDHVHVNYNP